MVILRPAPFVVGIVIVIGGAVFVLLPDEILQVGVIFPIDLPYALDPFLDRGMDEDPDTIGLIPQNIVGTTADNHAGAFLRDLLYHFGLSQEDLFRNRQFITDQVQVADEVDGPLLLHLPDKFFIESAFLGSQHDEFPVVKGYAQFLRKLPADQPAAAAILTTYGNGIFVHTSYPLHDQASSSSIDDKSYFIVLCIDLQVFLSIWLP